MIKTKPRFMYNEKNKKIGVVLKVQDFKRLIDELEDFEDYLYIKKYEGKKMKTFPFEDVINEIMGKR